MQFRFVRRSEWASLLLCAMLAGVAAWPGRVIVAQTPQQSRLVHVNEVQLRPETAPQWAELQRNELIPAQKKGGLAWRDTWAPANTGDVYLRAILTPITSLAQYDGAAPIVKALGEPGAQAFGEKSRRLITGSRGYIIRTRPDLGFGTRPAKPNIGLLTTVTVADGRSADFENFLKGDVVPGLKKANVGYYTASQVVYGGDVNQYMTLLLFENFAELAKGHPLERALGTDGMTRLTQKAAPFVTKLERTLIRYLADLSYGAPMTSSH
jgi:hypothetical protein